ncbi:MAG: hypothetical protein ACR2MU_03560 [Gaiellaceae bacterium]
MSHLTPRWLAGTARSRLLTLLGRLRREPSCSRVVPRPTRLGRGGRPLRLTHVLVSSDLEPRYLESWPLAARAWPAVAGLEPVLVLVAREAEVPAPLRDDPRVHVFEPLDGVHTAFQAQCVRLLYPALLQLDGAVLTADVDMLPANSRYFHRPVSRVDERHFVAYRDVLLGSRQIPICYNAALPSTWAEVFTVESLADVRERLRVWAAGIEYAGRRAGPGWDTDQELLYRTLLDWAGRTRRAWILDDHYTGHRRLERAPIEKRRGLTDAERRGVRRGRYSDYHALPPTAELRVLNEQVVDAAADYRRTT